MNVIQGSLLVNGKPKNGVTANLWRAEAFASPPSQGDAEPADVSYKVDTTTTGVANGSEGAYRFIGVDDGTYYVSLQFGGVIAWEAHTVSAGASSQEFEHKLASQDHEYAKVAAGDTLTVLDAQGAGVVRQIFFAITGDDKAQVEDGTTIQVFVNGQGTPAISCPLSQFFAYTFEADVFWTQRFAVTRKNYISATPEYDRGMYRYLNMPFNDGIRIVLVMSNTGTSASVWSVTSFDALVTKQDFGRDAYLKAEYFENLAIPEYTSVELLNINGRGRLDTLVLSIESQDGLQVLEGNLEIYRDGESLPSIYETGTEDITGNAFYFGPGNINGPYQGAPVHLAGPPAKTTQYRIFELDRLEFDTSLRIVWYAGHRGQGSALTQSVSCRSTIFYYVDQQPASVAAGALTLLLEDDFSTYGDGADVAGHWVQQTASASKWTQSNNQAVYTDTTVADAWMYRDDSNAWTDYVVEADVTINNFGTGEFWLFGRGTNSPDFNNRVTFGMSALGAYTDYPNYTPVMAFVASGAYRDSSLLLMKADQKNTLRMEFSGGMVILSVKRSIDSEFRELFRFEQTTRNDGYAGFSTVHGDVAVDAFRMYQRA